MKRIFLLVMIIFLFFCLDAPAGLAERTLTLPPKTITIAAGAFMGDISVTNAVLPDGIRNIGAKAFAGSSLREINLPPSLSYIADDAFEGCSSLTVTAYAGTYAESFCIRNGIRYIDPSTPATQFSYRQQGNGMVITAYTGSDTNVVIPPYINGLPVTAIGDKAFQHNDKITRVQMPASIVSIGDNAFDSCISVTEFVMPVQLKTIGVQAFMACHSVDCFPLHDSVEFIGEGAFYYNNSPVVCNAGTRTATAYTEYYYGCEAPTVNWHKGFISPSCPDYALMQFTSANGKSTLTTVQYLGSETHITLPAQIDGTPVTVVGEYIFSSYEPLQSVTLPDSFTGIEKAAFAGCPNLKIINLPDTIRSIGTEAFLHCTGNVFCHAGTDSAYAVTRYIENNSYAFGQYLEGFVSPTVPDYLLYQYNDESGAAYLKISKHIGGTGKISVPASINGVNIRTLGEGSFSNLVVTNVVVAEGITELENFVFFNSQNLESVTLPSTIQSIGQQVFYDCVSLKSFTFPDGLTGVPYSTFVRCSSLETVVLPDSMTFIGNLAFENCSSLKKIIIPEGVTAIESSAFSFAGLTEITIPASVKSIGQSAFSFCPAKSITILSRDAVMEEMSFTYDATFYCHKDSAVYNQLAGWGRAIVPLK